MLVLLALKRFDGYIPPGNVNISFFRIFRNRLDGAIPFYTQKGSIPVFFPILIELSSRTLVPV